MTNRYARRQPFLSRFPQNRDENNTFWSLRHSLKIAVRRSKTRVFDKGSLVSSVPPKEQSLFESHPTFPVLGPLESVSSRAVPLVE